MIRLTYCLRRRADLDRAAFLAYWRDVHGPLVRSFLPAMRVLRYVQMRALDGPLANRVAQSRGGPEPYDGVAELWWADLAAFEEGGRSPAGRAAGKALHADEKNFIDLARSPLFLSEVQLDTGGTQPGT